MRCLSWVCSTLALVYLGVSSGLGMRLTYSQEFRALWAIWKRSKPFTQVRTTLMLATSRVALIWLFAESRLWHNNPFPLWRNEHNVRLMKLWYMGTLAECLSPLHPANGKAHQRRFRSQWGVTLCVHWSWEAVTWPDLLETERRDTTRNSETLGPRRKDVRVKERGRMLILTGSTWEARGHLKRHGTWVEVTLTESC